MKVLVLGATGFLGSNLVRALIDRGDQVHALIRPIHSHVQAIHHRDSLAGLAVARVEGDLSDVESLKLACQGIHVVYHCAGYYPAETVSADAAVAQALAETRNLLEAVRSASVSRLVFVSSLTTIGFPKDGRALANEDCPFVPRYPDNPYLMAKAAMENEVLAASRQDVPAVVVNPTACFGPYDSKPTSGTQVLMIVKGMMPGYIQGETNAIDVRDVASGMIRAAEQGRIGQRYILGNWNTTQKDLNDLIARVAGVTAPMVPVPFPVARYGSKLGDWAFRTILRKRAPVPAFFVEALQHMQQYDCSKARTELNLPQSSIEQAIRDEIEWFRTNSYLPAA
jgi:dihydroflavonol-4-reductase